MKFLERLREIGRNLSVGSKTPKRGQMAGLPEAPKPKPDLAKAPLEKPARISNVNETANPLHVPEIGKENAGFVNTVPSGFDKATFFARLREGPLRHRTPEQVTGTEHILAACAGLPISWTAYALATAWHETGGKMSPNVETLNYSVAGLLNTFGRHRISRADAERLGRKPGEGPLSVTRQREIGNILYGGSWGRDNLGNTQPNDGWAYRGRGMAHDTGRRNYDLSGKAVGVDLLNNPDALLDVATAAKVMVSGMKTGRYTGHNFVRHLPTVGEANATQFGNARRIINGTDKQGEIAAHALTFQRALQAGGWQ